MNVVYASRMRMTMTENRKWMLNAEKSKTKVLSACSYYSEIDIYKSVEFVPLWFHFVYFFLLPVIYHSSSVILILVGRHFYHYYCQISLKWSLKISKVLTRSNSFFMNHECRQTPHNTTLKVYFWKKLGINLLWM